MADVEEEIRALKNNLFGSSNVPRSLIDLLYKRGASGLPATVIVDWTKEDFVVYWLDGQLFRGVHWIGFAENASASELAYPLSTLGSVKAEYELRYDDFTRRHDRWDRKVTLRFPDEEPIVIEIRVEEMQDNAASQFVDAVLSGVSQR